MTDKWTVDPRDVEALPYQRVELVAPDGKPARQAVDRRCPVCKADPKKRMLSAGFGEPHDVCTVCGHDFQERTL